MVPAAPRGARVSAHVASSRRFPGPFRGARLQALGHVSHHLRPTHGSWQLHRGQGRQTDRDAGHAAGMGVVMMSGLGLGRIASGLRIGIIGCYQRDVRVMVCRFVLGGVMRTIFCRMLVLRGHLRWSAERCRDSCRPRLHQRKHEQQGREQRRSAHDRSANGSDNRHGFYLSAPARTVNASTSLGRTAAVLQRGRLQKIHPETCKAAVLSKL